MSQTPVTIKIDADVKRRAQSLAQKLGLSLSAIIENELKQVISERRVVFEEEFAPNQQTAKQLAKIEADIKAGRNLSGSFSNFDDLERHLNSLGHAD
ncbi:MAG: type II toxin-antitoxin system RelB/DinJ family antitoxin [Candidatus Saccharimonadales bacterium]